ncbi:histone deacetylase HDT2 [Triticum aestivum]|uniref:histone deacetylase HDT2 n=1 Tax=Triticum aestivum TaxID=4565 RepID=UPI001D0242E0|nr:histone deacetylase HDT2-like [Triticum aestivum]
MHIIDVKPGCKIRFSIEYGFIWQLTQAVLVKSKEADMATMFVKVGDKRICIGTLCSDRFPQTNFDLFFEKDFELSHTSSSATVSFRGYNIFHPAKGDEIAFDYDGSGDKNGDNDAVDDDGADDDDDDDQFSCPRENNSDNDAVDDYGADDDDDQFSCPRENNSDNDAVDDYGADDDDDQFSCPRENNSDNDAVDDDGADDDDDQFSCPRENNSEGQSDENEEEQKLKKSEHVNKRAAGSAFKVATSNKKPKVAKMSDPKTGDNGALHVATVHLAKKAGPATNEKPPKFSLQVLQHDKQEVIIEKIVRNKRKCVTVVKGLELFGVNLSDASKKFGKKFAAGASVVKCPNKKEQIDVQGDLSYAVVEFIKNTWPDVEILPANLKQRQWQRLCEDVRKLIFRGDELDLK